MTILQHPLGFVNVSINSVALESKPADGDPVWAQMANTWEDNWVSPVDLEYFISAGHSFSCALTGTYRHSKYFKSVQHVCLDLDTEDERSDLPALRGDAWLQEYASFGYSTPSHRYDAPRSRVVIFLSEPVTDLVLYKLGVEAILLRYPYADQKCKDAVRWYLGSYHCAILRFHGQQELPIDVFLQGAADLKEQRRIEAEARAFVSTQRYNSEGTDTYNGQLADLLVRDVLNSPSGDRNNTFYRKGIKALARYGMPDAEPVIERLRQAAISIGLTEHEANTTYNSILRSSLL